jgi:hypothetical protein
MAELGLGRLLVPWLTSVCDLHGLEFLVKYVKPSRRDRLLRVSLLVHFRSRGPKAEISAKNF